MPKSCACAISVDWYQKSYIDEIRLPLLYLEALDLMVKNPFIGLKSRHLNSEDDFGMKTASNRKNKTTFTP